MPIIIETECRLYAGVQRREDLLIFLSVTLKTMGALELGQPQVHGRLGLAYLSLPIPSSMSDTEKSLHQQGTAHRGDKQPKYFKAPVHSNIIAHPQ